MVAAIPFALVLASCLTSIPTPANRSRILPDAVDRHARVLQLLEVGAPGRRGRVVAPALAPLEGARRALERPRDHAPDRGARRPSRSRAASQTAYSPGSSSTSTWAAICSTESADV